MLLLRVLEMIVLVFGGRDFRDRFAVHKAFAEFTARIGIINQVVHGNARGADLTGAQVAIDLGIPTRAFPADWDKYGKGAGPIRNQQMIDEGNIQAAIGFPGGRGTADMVSRLAKHGIPLWNAGAIPVDNYK